jgi:ABC-type lipoprotein release transport system permease subunit
MYKLVVKIAWASLSRRKIRSVLVVLMIAVSLWGVLFMEGIYDGMIEQMIGNAIRSGSGDITLFVKGYRLDNDLAKLITRAEDIDRLLGNDKRVKTYIMRIRQDGLVATAQYSRNASIYGIELEAERVHGRLDSYITSGEFGFGRKNKGVILGARLADKLKVKIGKKIILSAQNRENDVSSMAFKVTGIIKTNNMALDETAIFIDRDKARDLLLVPEGVTQVCMILHNEKDIPALQGELHKHFSELEVFRWDEIYPALMQSRVMMEWFNLVISLIVFCVAGLGIFGVMLVSVLERLREFGIMLAVGTKFSQIRQIVMAESFFLGFFGFLAGSLLGGMTLYYFYVHGLDLTMFSKGLDAFGMDAVTYAIIRPDYFVIAFIAVLTATFLSVLPPLRFLKKVKPIEVIRNI